MTTLEYAGKRLEEAVAADDPIAVNYWRGYIDGAKRWREYMDGEIEGERSHDGTGV